MGDGHQAVDGLNVHIVVRDHGVVEKQIGSENASKTNLLRGCLRTCLEDCVHGKCSQVSYGSLTKTFYML